jgi:uncharacterized protein YndB with AHSA1/START domain
MTTAIHEYPALNVVNDAIVQEIAINAPAERIFEALTNPAQLLEWWFAEGKFRATHVETNLRPGGKWLMHVDGSCVPGSACTVVRGEYVKIACPNLLIFTWNRDGEDFPETLVRWDLEEKDGVTLVRVTHSGLTTEAMRMRNTGWPIIQHLLQAYIARQA